MRTYQQYYRSIKKPRWAPHERLFRIAWSVIYPLLAIATFAVVVGVANGQFPAMLLWFITINWIANLTFTPIQLGLKSHWPASFAIVLTLGSLVFVELIAGQYALGVFWLLTPYLIWMIYATILQLTITATNP